MGEDAETWLMVASLPSRGAWIETMPARRLAANAGITPLAGSVD